MAKPGKASPATLARLLGNDVNLSILALLSTRPCYVRELATVLGRDEADISRRIKRLSEVGLVEGSWISVGDKNVKIYRLAKTGFRLYFDKGQVIVDLGGEEMQVLPKTIEFIVPDFGPLIGRRSVLEALASNTKPVTVVHGPPGVGKSHLVSSFLSSTLGKTPVYWHTVDSSDSLDSVVLKLQLFLSSTGYETSWTRPQTPREAAEIIVRGFEDLGAVLVVDDFHAANTKISRTFERVAEKVESASVYITSRYMPNRLRWISHKVFEIELGPMKFHEFRKILMMHGLNDPVIAEKIYRTSSGIPELGKIIASLVKTEGLEESVISAVEGFISRLIDTMDPGPRDLHEALALHSHAISADAACRFLGKSKGCRNSISEVARYGLLERRGDRLIPRELLKRYGRFIPPSRRQSLSSRMARVLLSSDDYHDRMSGFTLAIKECLVDVYTEAIRERILFKAYWPLTNLQKYVDLLKLALKCRNTMLSYMLVKAELGMFELTFNNNGSYFLSPDTERYIGFFKDLDPAIYVKLRSIELSSKSYIYSLEGREEELSIISAIADDVERHFYSLPRKLRTAVAPTVLANLASIRYITGRPEDTKPYYHELLEIVSKSDDIEEYAYVLAYKADHHRTLGEYEEVPRYALEAIEVGQALGLNIILFIAYITLAHYYLYKRDFKKAKEFSEKALKIPEKITYNLVSALIPYALTSLFEGNFKDFYSSMDEAIRLCREGLSYYPDCIVAEHLYSYLMSDDKVAARTLHIMTKKKFTGLVMLVESISEPLARARYMMQRTLRS